jgi:hypothetical protein
MGKCGGKRGMTVEAGNMPKKKKINMKEKAGKRDVILAGIRKPHRYRASTLLLYLYLYLKKIGIGKCRKKCWLPVSHLCYQTILLTFILKLEEV